MASRATGMRGQVQTMSRTGCLVSNSFIPSLSICLHFYPHRVRPHRHRPGPGQLHLPWSQLAPVPPRSSHQRAPVAPSPGPAAPLPSPPSPRPQGQTLTPHFGLLCAARPAPVPPLPSLSLSPHDCFPNTPARSCFPAFAWTVPSPGTILNLDIEMASCLLPPALRSNAAFPQGL